MSQRLSFSTDHWGYYNGTFNNAGFPNVPVFYWNTFTNTAVNGFTDDISGNDLRIANKNVNPSFTGTLSLKSITYPEGGKNEFIYEPNTASELLYEPEREHYFLTKKKNNQKSDIYFVSGTVQGDNITYSLVPTVDGGYYKSFIKEIDISNTEKRESLKMTLSSTFKASNFSHSVGSNSLYAEYSFYYYENGVKKYWINSASLTDEVTINYQGPNDPAISKIYLEVKHVYWGGLNSTSNISDYMYFYSQVSFNWEEQDLDFKEPIIYAGGIRIKEIKQYDNNGLYKYSSKYSYTKNGNNQLSSGVLFDIPMYTRNKRIGYIRSHSCYDGDTGNIKFIQDVTELSTRPVITGMRTQGRTIGYTNVEVVKTDAGNNIKGKEIFQYYVEPPLQTGDNALANAEGTSARYEFMESRDWRNGQLLKYMIFNSANDTLKVIKRDFYSGAPKATVSYNLERNIKMLFHSLVSPIDYLPGGTPLRSVFDGAVMMEPNVEIDGIFPSYIGVNTTISPGPFPTFVRHNDAFLLKQEEVTEYLSGGKKVSKLEYFYDDPLYPTKLTSKKEIFSDDNVLTTFFKYAYEIGNQLMLNRNMIELPLETTTIQTLGNVTKTLSKAEIIYPTTLPTIQTGNLVLPLSEKTFDILNLSTVRTEVSYDKYDNKGNILQYTTKDGIPVAIIWGYNQTRPIAKVQGVTYSWLIQNYPETIDIVNASNEDANTVANSDETTFLSVLDNFRIRLSIDRFNPLVTTYSYDPLIGIRSITPPSGIRESYIYDTANRLEKVVDVNGNVLKEMKYNYKN